jgi:hypothetical protein
MSGRLPGYRNLCPHQLNKFSTAPKQTVSQQRFDVKEGDLKKARWQLAKCPDNGIAQ